MATATINGRGHPSPGGAARLSLPTGLISWADKSRRLPAAGGTMVDPVPHQSFMASPLEGISWGLPEWEEGRDFLTFVILYRCWWHQGRLEVPAWVTHYPRRVSGVGAEGNTGFREDMGLEGTWNL